MFTVRLEVPSAIGGCDNLTIDATTSSGAGGRPWKSVVWRSNSGMFVRAFAWVLILLKVESFFY